jgi:hypothetical protein
MDYLLKLCENFAPAHRRFQIITDSAISDEHLALLCRITHVQVAE